MTTDSDLITRLRAADPVADATLPELDFDAITRTAVTSLAGHRSTKRNRVVRLALVASAAAVAMLAIPVISPHVPNGTGSNQTALGVWVPNAAAADLDVLAAKVTSAPIDERYAYWSEQQVNLTTMFDNPDTAPARYWDERTIQQWRGVTCDDRVIETWQPYKFLSPQDEATWRAWAQRPIVGPDDKTAADGGTRSWSGAQLWETPANGEPSNPCERGGSLANPTPEYAASLPTEPSALLDRLIADNGAISTPDDVASALISVLSIPWLPQEQRSAAIEAVGLLPQPWIVTERFTVAGHPALRLSREASGIREDLVVVAAAPGVWERTSTITDPASATEWSGGNYSGLPAGTVVASTKVTSSALVPDSSATP